MSFKEINGIEKASTKWRIMEAEEGKKNKSIEIAKKLKGMNMKLEDIAKATGLEEEEIEKL